MAEIIYVSELSGIKFNSIEKCEKHDANLLKVRDCYLKLVEMDFFSRFNIQPYFHNVNITNLGNPSKNSWYYDISGYYRMRGRMGNSDDILKLKIRNKYLLLLYGTCGAHYTFKYLCKIPLESFQLEDRKTYFDNFLFNYNKMPADRYNVYLEKRAAALGKLTEEDIKILGIRK